MSNSTIFSGSSRYASDFTAIIDRAVAIASLPLSQLQLTKQVLEAESSAIGSLNSKVTAVQTAISSLNSAAGLDSFSTSVSNGAVLSASVGAGAFNGTYTIEVTSLGAYSTAMSKDGLHKVTDPATETISTSLNPVYTSERNRDHTGLQYAQQPGRGHQRCGTRHTGHSGEHRVRVSAGLPACAPEHEGGRGRDAVERRNRRPVFV